MSKTEKQPSARQRLLQTAERLFYAEGIRAVGIDRIIAEAEVAKTTLYSHFPSKDALILAVLQKREVDVDNMFEKATRAPLAEPTWALCTTNCSNLSRGGMVNQGGSIDQLIN